MLPLFQKFRFQIMITSLAFIILFVIIAENFSDIIKTIVDPASQDLTNCNYKNPACPVEVRVEDLMKRMTVEEKVGQVTQTLGTTNLEESILVQNIGSFLFLVGDSAKRAMELNQRTRLQIPLLLGLDAIHGNCFINTSTVFPTQLGYSTSWDPDLAFKIGNITAFEMRYSGPQWTFSPVACLARDLRWGRIDETFGEDPYLISRLIVPFLRGLQGDSLNSNPDKVMATAKHYVGYGETIGGLDATTSELSHQKLMRFFMQPFEALSRAGAGSFMTSYTSVDGIPATMNKWLLRTMLKEKWNFSGFVITDWDNIGRLHHSQHVARDLRTAIVKAFTAGTDMAMCTKNFYEETVNAVKEGQLPMSVLDDAVRRVLTTKFRLGLFEDPRIPDEQKLKERTGLPEHRAVALEAALKSLVLLENKGILPLRAEEYKKVLLLGKNANDVVNQLGDWTLSERYKFFNNMYDRSTVSTIKDGLKKRFGDRLKYKIGCTIDDEDDTETVEEAMKNINSFDLVVIVVGDSLKYTGEFHSTGTLHLMGSQEELINRVAKTKIPFIIGVVSSKPLILPKSAEQAQAVIQQFNPGMLGGEAFARIVLGEDEPRGRLTLSIPQSVGQMPAYYQRPRAGHGGYEDVPGPIAKYPFGYGLLYTTMEYTEGTIEKTVYSKDDTVVAKVTIKNTGNRKGTEVVQCYVHHRFSSIAQPTHDLVDFKVVTIESGAEAVVEFNIKVSDFKIVDENEEYVVEEGEKELWIGKSATDLPIKLKFSVVENDKKSHF